MSPIPPPPETPTTTAIVDLQGGSGAPIIRPYLEPTTSGGWAVQVPAPAKPPQLSVISPMYNEVENVQRLYDRVKDVLEKMGLDYEIIFVNDGSGDGTGKIIDEIAAKDPRFKAVHLRRSFGQTAAMSAGFDHAWGDVIVAMDGDLQNDPADIPRLLAKLNEGWDVVSGWREKRRDAFLRTRLSRVANGLISRLTNVHLHDYGCTLKAYRREIIKGIRLYGEMHRFIPVYATWQGARVTELPVGHSPRQFGKSKYGFERTVKVILDLIVIKFLGNYHHKPIYVFGALGLLCLALGFVSGLWAIVLKFWFNTTFVQTPLPLLCVLLFVLGVMAILLGLVAEMMTRTYYESQSKPTYLVRERRNFHVPPQK